MKYSIEDFKNIPGMFVVNNEPPEVTQIRAHILNSFKDLIFYEGPHVYELHRKKLTSVTTVLGRYMQPFDQEKASRDYAKKNGHTPEYWLNKWLWKNKIATTTGSLVHEFGESFSYVLNGHPEKITESCKCKYMEDKNWLIPTRGKEEAIINYWSSLPPNLHFVYAEAKLFTNSNADTSSHLKQQLAGTADILLYYRDSINPENSGLVIADYKTNADLYKSFSRNNKKMMLPPFNQFYSEPFGEYIAQFSTYQIPLEDIGFRVIARRLVWLKDDGSFEVIPTPDISKIIRQNL